MASMRTASDFSDIAGIVDEGLSELGVAGVENYLFSGVGRDWTEESLTTKARETRRLQDLNFRFRI